MAIFVEGYNLKKCWKMLLSKNFKKNLFIYFPSVSIPFLSLSIPLSPLCPFMSLCVPLCPFVFLSVPSCPFVICVPLSFVSLCVPLCPLVSLCVPLCPFMPLYTPFLYKLLHAFTCIISWAATETSSQGLLSFCARENISILFNVIFPSQCVTWHMMDSDLVWYGDIMWGITPGICSLNVIIDVHNQQSPGAWPLLPAGPGLVVSCETLRLEEDGGRCQPIRGQYQRLWTNWRPRMVWVENLCCASPH